METQKNINPLLLVREIAKPRLVMGLIIAFIAHVIFLGVTSIGFIGDCVEYKTVHPKAVKKALEKEKEEAEKLAKKLAEEKKGAEEQAKREAEQKKLLEDAKNIVAQDEINKRAAAEELEKKKKAEEERKKREEAGSVPEDAPASAAPQKPANLGNEKASDSAIDFAD